MYIKKNLTDFTQYFQRVQSRLDISVPGITDMKLNVLVCSRCRKQGHSTKISFGFPNTNNRMANGHVQNISQDTQKPY
jgi:hypothetical protein